MHTYIHTYEHRAHHKTNLLADDGLLDGGKELEGREEHRNMLDAANQWDELAQLKVVRRERETERQMREISL
jgi:hypothetical protein